MAILVIMFIILLLFFTVKDYQAKQTEIIAKNRNIKPLEKDTFNLLIWNIGYCGLSQDMSFFYDGGEKVRTSQKQTRENLKEIKNHLNSQKNIDFFLLQEVDKKSKRSYRINEYKELSNSLSNHNNYFAYNYKVLYVPIPVSKPLGKVQSGLASFSSQKPKKVTRHQFPGNYSWPKKIFMLDRCFLVLRHPLRNGKELLIINTHNSAYDDGGLKAMQMEYLKSFILKEYEKGNYIIIGGDWNQYPPDIKSYPGSKKKYNLNKTSTISKDYVPDHWTWAYDPTVATNRSLDKPLNKDTDKAVIDFYLISPNVQLLNIKTQDLNFKNSDHQPVYCKIKLK
jgi:endonuclease/exonuclease/phosphatase family metal-dependent hydrolase